MRPTRLCVVTAAGLLLIGCGGGDRSAGTAGGDVGGTVIIAAPAEPGVIVPAAASSTADKQVVDQIFDFLAEIGPGLNTVGDAGWTPRLAQRWTWSADSLSIAFHIDPRARWHDGQPVRAGDVRFSVELFKDPKVNSISRESFDNVDSVSVRDSLTAVVWFKRHAPEQFFELAYNLLVAPEHLLKDADRAHLEASSFARNPIGSGPFRFVRWETRSRVELVADTSYYLGRPKLDRLIFLWNPDVPAALNRVLSGEADFTEFVTADAMPLVAAAPSVAAVPYRSINYGYLVFNPVQPKDPGRPHTLFADRGVRVALTMALDRRAMLQNALDSLGAPSYGPFSLSYATADTTLPQIAFDPAGAALMLDSLGWRDTNGDGMRERNGQPLRFGLLTPTSSVHRRRYSVLIQEQLRRVGARVDIEEADPQAMVGRMFSGQYDAFVHGATGDPSPRALRQSWRSADPRNRGFNFAAYANPAVDALMDSAQAEFDPTRSRDYYQRAYRTIVNDAPVVWLYELRQHAAVHRRVHPVLDRADVWWRDIRFWSIPADQRIDRDRIGLAAAK